MDISAALAADLAALTKALDDPEIDLEAGLRALAASVAVAVRSFSGLTVTIRLDGHAISFSAPAAAPAGAEKLGAEIDRGAPAASLAIPLSALTAAQDGSTLVLYAAVAGAFVDLAADLSYLLDLDPEVLTLDRHLHSAASSDGSGMTGLAESSLINQAIGVLISRGHTAEGALDELRRLAKLDGGTLRGGADAVLRSLTERTSIDDRSAKGRDDDPRR